MDKPDWEAIRREYEAGNGSFREIAERYQVKLTTLYDRSKKWQKPNAERRTPNAKKPNAEQEEQTDIAPIHALRLLPAPSPANAKEGANLGLNALVTYLKVHSREMDLADHVRASNALAQYNKILVNALPDEDEEESELEDWSVFTEEELELYSSLQERAKKKA